MRKSQANRTVIAARAGKSEPNHAILTTGPVGCNLIARVEIGVPARGDSGKNRAPKITTGQKYWDRPANLGDKRVTHDVRWSA